MIFDPADFRPMPEHPVHEAVSIFEEMAELTEHCARLHLEGEIGMALDSLGDVCIETGRERGLSDNEAAMAVITGMQRALTVEESPAHG